MQNSVVGAYFILPKVMMIRLSEGPKTPFILLLNRMLFNAYCYITDCEDCLLTNLWEV